MFENVVHGHHVRAGQGPGQPEQVRHVDQIATQSPQYDAKFKIAKGGSVEFGERNGVKIGG